MLWGCAGPLPVGGGVQASWLGRRCMSGRLVLLHDLCVHAWDSVLSHVLLSHVVCRARVCRAAACQGEGEDEDADDLVNQVLDEIGITTSSQVRGATQHTAGTRHPTAPGRAVGALCGGGVSAAR